MSLSPPIHLSSDALLSLCSRAGTCLGSVATALNRYSSPFVAYIPLDDANKCIQKIKILSLLYVGMTLGAESQSKSELTFLRRLQLCRVLCWMPMKDEYDYHYSLQMRNQGLGM